MDNKICNWLEKVKIFIAVFELLSNFQFEMSFQFGALHLLLSPRQLHGLMELLSGISTPGINFLIHVLSGSDITPCTVDSEIFA